MAFPVMAILGLGFTAFAGYAPDIRTTPATAAASVRAVAAPSREHQGTVAREFEKSRMAVEQGRLEDAVLHLREALVLDPANANARFELGVVYHQMKQPEKAVELFTSVVGLDPLSFRAHLNLSILFHGMRRYEDSERMARKAIELRKMDLRARYMLGVSLAALRKLPEEALEHLRAASSEYPDALLEVSRLLIEKGELDAAVESLRKFSKQNRDFDVVGIPILAR